MRFTLLVLLLVSTASSAMDTHSCAYWLHKLGEQEYLESLYRYHVDHGERDRAEAIFLEIRKARERNDEEFREEEWLDNEEGD